VADITGNESMNPPRSHYRWAIALRRLTAPYRQYVVDV
jgi:hypothetical protein